MTLELQERTDHNGEVTYWIMKNGMAEIPIYRDRDIAEKNFKNIVDFYKSPTPIKVLATEIVNI